jgi:hypothetical protein
MNCIINTKDNHEIVKKFTGLLDRIENCFNNKNEHKRNHQPPMLIKHSNNDIDNTIQLSHRKNQSQSIYSTKSIRDLSTPLLSKVPSTANISKLTSARSKIDIRPFKLDEHTLNRQSSMININYITPFENRNLFKLDDKSSKINLNLNVPIYKETTEIDKKFLLDKPAISHFLKKKYNFMRNISSAKTKL